PRDQIALACQRAENEYTGAQCGIMDQFVSCFGIAGHTIIIDCRDLSRDAVPLPCDISIVVCNTKVTHAVAGGEYNSRKSDCERSVKKLKAVLPNVKALRDVNLQQLEQNRDLLTEIEFRRCLHVISENMRVQTAASAFKNQNAQSFGEL